MKVVRGILVFLINIVLFVLILGLSLVIRTKTFLEKELAMPLIKETISMQMEENKLPSDYKEAISKIMEDESIEKIVDRSIQNFLEYKNNDNYKLSQDDYNMVMDFILKYKDEINMAEKSKLSEEEIRKLLKYEDFDKMIKEAFENIDKGYNMDTFDIIINAYTTITGTMVQFVLIAAIVIFILLIMLVSWSLIKWMLVTGIDLIIVGALISAVYILGTVAKSYVKADEMFLRLINSVSLTGFIIMGVIEIVIGIVLIVLYAILKKKTNKTPQVVQG